MPLIVGLFGFFIGEITNVEVIARGNGVRRLKTPMTRYGGKNWRKMKGLRRTPPPRRGAREKGRDMAAFLYEFDWNPAKAQANFSKHGVDFERAATVYS